MIRLNSVIPVLLICCSSYATFIDLSGTVTNNSGKAIKGAIVTILGQGMKDTTNTRGGYKISNIVPVTIHEYVPRTDRISFNRGIITFSLSSTSEVMIELYTVQGKLIKKVVNRYLASGSYRFTIASQLYANTMMAIRVSIDSQQAIFRHLPMLPMSQTVTFSATKVYFSIEGGLAKIQDAMDSLEVKAPNYKSKKVALSSYEDEVDITLDTIASEIPDTVDLPLFSFFVTSQEALEELSGSQNGFGGDFRFGKTGPGAGLLGADSICSCIAERSMPGSSVKKWRAFLSVKSGPDGKQVNAIDRVGKGPWYDRLGRMLAPTKEDLLHERPTNGSSAIANDLPNEDGIPNHRPDPNGSLVDNHHFVTGTGTDGKLYVSGSTCDDWTNVNASGRPRCGFSWPRSMGGRGGAGNWISGFDAGGCKAGVHVSNRGMGASGIIGMGGGYGGFYCFALVP